MKDEVIRRERQIQRLEADTSLEDIKQTFEDKVSSLEAQLSNHQDLQQASEDALQSSAAVIRELEHELLGKESYLADMEQAVKKMYEELEDAHRVNNEYVERNDFLESKLKVESKISRTVVDKESGLGVEVGPKKPLGALLLQVHGVGAGIFLSVSGTHFYAEIVFRMGTRKTERPWLYVRSAVLVVRTGPFRIVGRRAPRGIITSM